MTKDEAIEILKEYRTIVMNCLEAEVPAFDLAIESLSAEPSGDLISREEAIEIIASHDETNGTEKVFAGREITDLLASLPSADRPTEYNLETIADIVRQLGHLDGCIADMCDRQKGEWLDVEHEPFCECSVCGAYIENLDDDFAFCPRCGADMRPEK